MVTAEAEGRVDFMSTAEEIKRLFKTKLNVTPNVSIVSINTLPRSEKKTKRIFDHRGD
jgi:phenylacetate-CoA ligase